MVATLQIDERVIRGHGPGNVALVCWRQWRAERGLDRRGVHFRATDLAQVAAAYRAMSQAEFDAINGRQDWANWRTIPRALSGHVPDRPLRVLDLGCGTGSSTLVLAYYCPRHSSITGFELAAPLLAFAQRRVYRTQDAERARVDFVCQEVTETLRQPDGAPVANATVDVVNASGVVGHHLTDTTIGPLVREIVRVLKPGGVAMLDVGPTLPANALTRIMTAAGFDTGRHARSWWFDPTGQIVFRWGSRMTS